MHNVLITTNHPAPYIDRWMYELEKIFDATIIYNHLKDKEKTWSNFTGYPGKCYEVLSFSELLTLVKKNDLLIVGGWTNAKCFKTIILGKLLGKKVGIFTDYPFHQNKYVDIFKKIFLYRFVDFIFCATKSTCDFVEKKYKLSTGKTKFFPYAVDFPQEREAIEVRDENGKIPVLIANNFVERKGHAILFDAFDIIAKSPRHNDFVFHIAGHGELFEKYKELSKKLDLDIKFYGWCELEQYNSLQAQTLVFIHPSLEEPFGIPPLDAMAGKKVVIVSDGVKSTDSLIKNNINGFIYPAHDAARLADIILSLNPDELKEIGMNARNDVITSYSLQHIINSIESCF